MNKYECTICGYIYDPEVGDADAMIAAGTPFEELPEDWTCPICRVDKSHFIEIDNNKDSCSCDSDCPCNKAPQHSSRIDEEPN